MNKIILSVLLLTGICFAADSLAVTTINRPQKIDTIKASLVAPTWSYEAANDTTNRHDTCYLKRNGIVRVRLQWINPGSIIVCDTTVIWRPADVGIDAYKFVPRVKLHFTQN